MSIRLGPLLRTRAMRQLSAANFLVGLSSSIALPFLPLFLTARVGASATEVGLLLTLSGTAGVLVSGGLGSLSDRLLPRKPLIAAGCAAAAAYYVVCALSRSYPLVLVASVTLLTGAWVAVPQLYARCRELLDALGAAPALSLSALRSMVSVAWIGGPPLAGLVLTIGGFPPAFALVAATLLAAAALALADGAPEARTVPGWSGLRALAVRPSLPRPTGVGAVVALSVGAVALLQMANSMSVTTMPLLVTVTLHGTPRDVGLIFGVSAALEIPLMLGLGWAAGRFGALRVMLVTWLFGVLYFVALALAASTWQLVAAQALSAVYVPGLYAVGIAYFQELIAEPGSASTLFFNSVTAGSTVAGVLWGAAVAVRGYRGALAGCAVLAAASVVLLGAGHLVRRQREQAG